MSDPKTEDPSISPPYKALLETEACKRCHEGETWSVKGPREVWIGQSWVGENAQADAEEAANALNAAYEEGYEAGIRS